MQMKMECRLLSLAASAVLLFAAGPSVAANGVWNGTQDACWTNSLNWSASPYPNYFDTAFFTNAGNGQTSIDLSGLPSLKYLTFDSPSVAAYSLGTGAPGSQTFVLVDGGEIKLSATAGNSQAFNSGVQLGVDWTAQSYSFRNDNASRTLTFDDISGCAPNYYGTQGTKTLSIYGSGNVSVLGNLVPNGASGIILSDFNPGTLTLAGSNTLYTLNVNTNSVIDIGNGELFLNNSGANVFNINQNCTINGTGKIRLSTSDMWSVPGSYNYADCNVAADKTLVINAGITSLGGLEIWSGAGNYVLNGTNTFLGHICFGTASSLFVSRIGNRGSLTSNCGQGTNIYFNSSTAGSRLVYTGTGETSDRVISLNQNGIIDQSGPSGKLTFSASPYLPSAKTLILQGSTAGVGEFTAPLVNNGNTLTLTKNGTGTWILSNTNTYSGSTTVNGGKLVVSSSGQLTASAVTVNSGATLASSGLHKGAVTVAAGGVLSPADINTVGTMTLSNTLSLTSATLLFDASNTAVDRIAVTNYALTVNGTNTVVLSLTSSTLPVGTNTLMTFLSRTGSGSFVLSPAYANAFLITNATSVMLAVTNSSLTNMVWNGNVSTAWDGTDQNWLKAGSASTFTAGDAALFDDTATSFTVSSLGAVQPASVTFENSANDYTVSAAIGGAAPLYTLGAGNVTLTGTNTFSGPITLAGKLTVGDAGVLGNGNYATNIVNGGTLIYASSVAQTNSGAISGGGDLTVSGNSQLTISGSNTYSGATTLAGPGTLTLSGNSSYSGPTYVNGGTLKMQNPSALGSTSAGTVVNTNGTLEVAGGISTASEALNLFGTLSNQTGNNTYGGTITLQAGAFFDVGAGTLLSISGSTAGNGNFTKKGLGTLRFTADPNHTGPCVISEGTLELAHAGTTDGPYIINPGATLRTTGTPTTGPLGKYRVIADGTLDIWMSNTIDGLDGSGLVTIGTASNATLSVGNSNQSGVFSGVISNGLGVMSFTKAGTGIQTLSGANTYSGTTTLSGGQLNINNAKAIGTGAFTIGGYTIDNTSGSGITLTANNAQNWNGDFTFIGSSSLNLGTGAVTMNANRIVTVNTNILTVGGAVGGAFSLTKNGAGTLTLNGANTYSGATTVNGGQLLINGSTAAGAVTVNNGALLGGSGTVSGAVTVNAGGMLAPGGISAGGTLSMGSTLALNGNTLFFDISNVSTDKVAAAGALTLNGTNTIALAFPNGSIPAGSYTLMTFASRSGSGTFVLSTALTNAVLTVNATSVVLGISGSGVSSLTWKGNLSSSWDGTDQNWVDGVTPATYAAGAAVTFDDTAANNYFVTNIAAVAPSSILINNSANDYLITATISGTGSVVKAGYDTAVLSGLSAFNPCGLFVNAGMLVLGGQLNGGTYAGNIADQGVLNYGGSGSQTLSGMVSGTGGLTLSGNGTLVLSGSNTYSGVTLVNAGTLRVQGTNALGSTASGTTVALGATLEIAGGIGTAAEALTLNGTLSSQTAGKTNVYAGAVTANAGAVIDVGAGSGLNLSASIQANGPFTKTGAGALRFLSDPNGLGVMTINGGVADLAQGSGGMDANIVVNDGGTLIVTGNNGDAINGVNRVTVNAGGRFDLRQSEGIAMLSGAGTVTRDIAGASTFTVSSALSDTFSGVIQNGAGTVSFAKAGTGSFTLTGVNTFTGSTTLSGGSLFINSPGSLSSGAVTVSNNGTTLGGNGAIGGSVTLSAGTYLVPGGYNAIGTLSLGSTLALSGNTLFFDLPATLTTPDQVTATGALTLNGANTVALSFPNGAAPAGDYTLMTFPSYTGSGSFALLYPYPNASLELTATSLILHISGSGSSALTWNGNLSMLWDGGAMNWEVGATPASFTTGDAVVFDDTATQFSVQSATGVSPSAIVFNNSLNNYFVAANILGTNPIVKYGTATANIVGGTTYNPTSITVYAGTLSFGNASQLNGGSYAPNLYINGGATFNHASSANQILSGVINGGGAFTKTGGGSLTLTNANTHSGGTTVSGGTLYAKQFPAALGTGTVSLNGGTLELDYDTPQTINNALSVGGNATLKSGRLTSGAGLTQTLSTVSIGTVTWSVAAGSNLSANSPYGLTFGTATLNANNGFLNIANNGTGIGTLTLGALVNNNSFVVTNNGTLFLGTASSRSSGNVAVGPGTTLKLGNPSALGTSGATLQLNGGTLDLAIDTSVNAHSLTVYGPATGVSTTLCDKATLASAGITHTLGNLTIGTNSLFVTNGPNVIVNSPFGLTLGTCTLNGTAVFEVGNNGTGLGTLTLNGAASGNFGFVKRGAGSLVLGGNNTYVGATTNVNGRLVGMTGGSSSNSSVFVQSIGANAAAILGVSCVTANGQWTCTNLTTSAGVLTGAAPALDFSFSLTPSATTAPLRVLKDLTFGATPGVTVYLNSIGNVPAGTYPLIVVGGTAPVAVPALTVVGGYSGSTLSWSGNTLNLNLTGTSEQPLHWAGTGTGTWNINTSGNLIWKNSAAVPSATYYREGLINDQVMFDDTQVTSDQTVTLNTFVTPSSMIVSNTVYKFTLSGTGGIVGTNSLTKIGSGTFVLATTNNAYSGFTLLNDGTLAMGSALAFPPNHVLSMAGTSTLDLNGTGATLANVTNSTAANTVTDNSAGGGTTALILNNHTATLNALIKDGASKTVAVTIMNNNFDRAPFPTAAANTYSGGLTLKYSPSLSTGTRLRISTAITTVGTPGNITSGPYGKGPISIGSASTDKAQILFDSVANNVLLNDIVVNTTNGTDYIYAFRSDTAGNIVKGAVTLNADLTSGGMLPGALIFSNVISGAYGVRLVGTNSLTLAGLNTYTGKTTINSGTLNFNTIGDVGAGASSLGAPTTVSAGTINLGGTLNYVGGTASSDRVLNLFTGNPILSNNGSGTLTLSGGVTGGGYTLNVFGGLPIVISGLIGHGGGVFKTNGNILYLNNAGNTFPGSLAVADGTVVIGSIANSGVASSIGQGSSISLGQNGYTTSGTLQFTGAGGGSCNRTLIVNGNGANVNGGALENTVAGQTLTFSGNVGIGSGTNPQLQLIGAGDGVMSGVMTGALRIVKAGLGTWTLTGANNNTGVTAVNGGALVLSGANGALAGSSSYAVTSGATLVVNNAAGANNGNRLSDAGTLTLNGGTLSFFNDGSAASFSESAGPLVINLNTSVVNSVGAQIGQTSALTFTSLTRATNAFVNFTGDGIGVSDCNRIFITGQADGLIGYWATVNGTNMAAYSSVLGVYVATNSGVAAQGGVAESVIPNNAASVAEINLPGTSGPITLEAEWTNQVYLIRQNYPVDSTIATFDGVTNKALLTTGLFLNDGMGSLTLGVNPGEGFLAPLTFGGPMVLQNDSTNALLTVNAPLTDNGIAGVLQKYGVGKVVLAGSNTFAGPVSLYSGTLEFGGPYTQKVSNVISGAGALGKSGSGVVTLYAANTYTGPTYINAGMVRVDKDTAFGPNTNTSGIVYINPGATLNVGCTPDVGGTRGKDQLDFGTKQFIVSGAGFDGAGAINNTSTAMQYKAFSRISLAADATFGANQRWDINTSASPALDLNGYTLSKTGTAEVAIHGGIINPGAGNIVVNQGILRFEAATLVNGTSNNTVTVNSGGTLDLWNLTPYVPTWTAILNEGATFGGSTQNTTTTNINIWAGPITLNGKAYFKGTGSGVNWTVLGDVSGTGTLFKTGVSPATMWVMSSNNTYSGGTVISNGTLFAKYAGSLNYSNVTLVGGATLSIPSGDGLTGWNGDQLKTLHDTSTFTANTAVLQIDTSLAPLDYYGNLNKTLALTKNGTNTLTLVGTNAFTGALIVNAGDVLMPGDADHNIGNISLNSTNRLTFTGNGNHLLGSMTVGGGSSVLMSGSGSHWIKGAITLANNTSFTASNAVGLTVYVTNNNVTVGNGTSDTAQMTLAGQAALTAWQPGQGTNAPALTVGNGGRGVVVIQDNANVAMKIMAGSTAGTGSGAIYQRGGYVLNLAGNSSDSRIGLNGYGYYELDSGTLTNKGYTQLAQGSTGIGILSQYGGELRQGNSAGYGGNFTVSRGGTGVLYQAGGVYDSVTTMDLGGISDNSGIRGYAEFTMANGSTALNGNLNMADRTNMLAIANFNGGTLYVNQISKSSSRTGSVALVNFNGGTFKARAAGNMINVGASAPTAVNIYQGGAVIDSTNLAVSLSVPLLAPAGGGVTGITITPRGGYMGPPFVSITGGGGTGATAIAQFNSADGTVSGVTITSPGFGYTSLPTVTLVGGGTNIQTAVTGVTIGDNVSGGLTKIGTGTLTLAATNTYGGATTISNGTLRLGVANALPTNAAVNVAGGVYDLNGFTVTNGVVTLFSGSVINGLLSGTQLSKSGDGAVTLSVPYLNSGALTVSGGTLKLSGVQPGLYEGRVSGSFDLTTANPRTAVQPSVTNAYLYFTASTSPGSPWVSDNSTFIYSGYIWNNTGTNAVWSFSKAFDDSVLIKIDAFSVLNNTVSGATVVSNYTLTPGPHPFEVRLGQGAGAVGANGSGWNLIGVGVDRMGRGVATPANFQRLADPGDGSLLTLTAVGPTNQLAAGSTLDVATNAVLDLGGTVQSFTDVSGSGLVSNGTLVASGTIAPGGTNNIGTLTVNGTALLGGATLLADVASDGSSDLLAVQGNVNLSGMTLQVANQEQLNHYKTYTIVSYTGTRTGTFSSTNLTDSHWHILYLTNGTIKLFYETGTLIKIR